MPKFTLKAARIQSGFKQKEVCKILNISRNALHNYENGISTPSVILAYAMADMYGVDINNIDFLCK